MLIFKIFKKILLTKSPKKIKINYNVICLALVRFPYCIEHASMSVY